MKNLDVIDSPAVVLQGARVAVLTLYLADIISEAEHEELSQRVEAAIDEFYKKESKK